MQFLQLICILSSFYVQRQMSQTKNAGLPSTLSSWRFLNDKKKNNSLTKQHDWKYTARKESNKNVPVYAACHDQLRCNPKSTKSRYKVARPQQLVPIPPNFLCIGCVPTVTDLVIQFTSEILCKFFHSSQLN